MAGVSSRTRSKNVAMAGVSSRTRSKNVPLFGSLPFHGSCSCSLKKRRKSDMGLSSKKRKPNEDSFVLHEQVNVICINSDEEGDQELLKLSEGYVDVDVDVDADADEDWLVYCNKNKFEVVDVKNEELSGDIVENGGEGGLDYCENNRLEENEVESKSNGGIGELAEKDETFDDEKCGLTSENPIIDSDESESDNDDDDDDDADESEESEEIETSDEEFQIDEVNEVSDSDNSSSSYAADDDNGEEKMGWEEEVEVEEKKMWWEEEEKEEKKKGWKKKEEEKKKKGWEEEEDKKMDWEKEEEDKKMGWEEEEEEDKKMGWEEEEEEDKKMGWEEEEVAVEEEEAVVVEEVEVEEEEVAVVVEEVEEEEVAVVVEEVEEVAVVVEEVEEEEVDLEMVWQEYDNVLAEMAREAKGQNSNDELEHADDGNVRTSNALNQKGSFVPMETPSSSKLHQASETLTVKGVHMKVKNVSDDDDNVYVGITKSKAKESMIIGDFNEEKMQSVRGLGVGDVSDSSIKTQQKKMKGSDKQKVMEMKGRDYKGRANISSSGEKKEPVDKNGWNQRGKSTVFRPKELRLVELLAEYYWGNKINKIQSDSPVLEIKDVIRHDTRPPPVCNETAPLIWSLKKVEKVQKTKKEEEEEVLWDQMDTTLRELEAESMVILLLNYI